MIITELRKLQQTVDELIHGKTIEGLVTGVFSDEPNGKYARVIVEQQENEGAEVVVYLKNNESYPLDNGTVAMNYVPYRTGMPIHIKGIRRDRMKPWVDGSRI